MEKVYYIVYDATYNPGYSPHSFSGLHDERGLLVWKNKDNAFTYLKENINDERFGIIHSTIELIKEEMIKKIGRVTEIYFMD